MNIVGLERQSIQYKLVYCRDQFNDYLLIILYNYEIDLLIHEKLPLVNKLNILFQILI